MNNKIYLKTWFISLMFALWFFILPPIIGVVCLIMKHFSDKATYEEAFKNKNELQSLTTHFNELQIKYNEIGATEYYEVKEKINQLESQINVAALDKISLDSETSELRIQLEKLNTQVTSQTRKLAKTKEIYKSIDYAINNFFQADFSSSEYKISPNDLEELESISPSVILKLHCMDVKDLHKAYKENDKQINQILELYSSRYTTKANKAIYQLMVIALRAELQNILFNLKYEKLDKSIKDLENVTNKYLKIASDGNQSIAGTLTKFISEIEYLFINAIKIEYNYYVKKEQAKQEQLAIREQMRQEAAERKALEAEKRKIEQEEEKFKNEIDKLNDQLKTASNEELEQLNARILELQLQLSDVIVKKEEIMNLQNGKAGNVYIISNLGSFGDNVFKIGMTRRLNPQDRVDELGSASVPFRFDVHSFIFSDNAVDLENKLHNILQEKRVNKVNLRKEFFFTSIDELEVLINEIEPTAEFNRTMLAEDFKESQSTSAIYSSDYFIEEDSDDE